MCGHNAIFGVFVTPYGCMYSPKFGFVGSLLLCWGHDGRGQPLKMCWVMVDTLKHDAPIDVFGTSAGKTW